MNLIDDNLNVLLSNSRPNEKTEHRVADIADYLSKWGIKNVVLGLSGGIDSAFVFQLLIEARKTYKFAIHTVFFKHSLHEYEAEEGLVDQLIAPYEVHHKVIDLSGIVSSTNDQDSVESAVVDTQYAYALMYTLLFREAQIVGGITFGTTNRDELGIGWFGKNSDMVVDIQPIHDFHKFEIYQSDLCRSIPSSISGASPDGNLLTGLTDEEVFGCTYDVVSSVVDLMGKNQISIDDLQDYPKLKEVIDKNAHKLVKPRTEFNPIFL